MTKKKKEKETLTSDGITYQMDDWVPSDGLQYAGTGTVDSLDPGLDVDFNVCLLYTSPSPRDRG